MNKTFTTVVSITIIILSTLVYLGTQATVSRVIMPSELLRGDAPSATERIRVVGRVTEDEIAYTLEPEIKLLFSIQDPSGGDGKVQVQYNGLRPDMFEPGRDVIIDGRFSDGVLIAAQLLTQCPSKYEAPDPEQIYNEKNPEVLTERS